MTLQEVNDPRFKYFAYFSNTPRENTFYIVKNQDFIVVVETGTINHNDLNVKIIQVLYQKDPVIKIEFTRIRIQDISKNNTKEFKNKLGMFGLSKHHFPELYL